MGYYIQTAGAKGKAAAIVLEHNATIIPCPKRFDEVPDHKALICVVENPAFDAAGFCYDEREFQAWTAPDHGPYQRPRTWLVMDRKTAEILTEFRS